VLSQRKIAPRYPEQNKLTQQLEKTEFLYGSVTQYNSSQISMLLVFILILPFSLTVQLFPLKVMSEIILHKLLP
jgi:hypothetical protein